MFDHMQAHLWKSLFMAAFCLFSTSVLAPEKMMHHLAQVEYLVLCHFLRKLGTIVNSVHLAHRHENLRCERTMLAWDIIFSLEWSFSLQVFLDSRLIQRHLRLTTQKVNSDSIYKVLPKSQ